jgi:hypothetical protein
MCRKRLSAACARAEVGRVTSSRSQWVGRTLFVLGGLFFALAYAVQPSQGLRTCGW